MALVVAMLGAGAEAGTLSLVTTRSAIGGDDHVYWGNAVSDRPTNPFTIGSYGGIDVTVSQAGAPAFSISQQAAPGPVPPGGYGGNFSPGDYVLVASGNGSGPVSLSFAAPISAAGAQIAYFFPGAFTARIEAFDAAGNSLGSFTEDGVTTGAADGSAIFLGVSDTVEEITRVEFSVLVGPTFGQNLAINTLSFISSSSVPGTNPDRPSPPLAVPEPSSLSLAGIGLAVLLLARSRRYRAGE